MSRECRTLGCMPVESSGHVFRVERRRGPQWYAKFRLPDGRQVQRLIGPAWTERGRPVAGYYTKHGAEAWLREVLDQVRRGTFPGQKRTGVTFAEATEEWLRHVEHDRQRKPSTVVGYRALVKSQLLPFFGDRPVESITTPMIERWLADVDRAPSTRRKSLMLLHGIMRRAVKRYGLPSNPVADIDKPQPRPTGDIEVFSPEEVRALVRAAGSEQDAAIYLTAAFTGLRRGEPWRSAGATSTSAARSSACARTTPAASSRRPSQVRSDRCRWRPTWLRLWPRSGSARRGRAMTTWSSSDRAARSLTAPLSGAATTPPSSEPASRPLRFHDLRHTFGTRMIAKADIRRVQEWMGHADVQTTMKYLHYVPRAEDAALVAAAFAVEAPADSVDARSLRPARACAGTRAPATAAQGKRTGSGTVEPCPATESAHVASVARSRTDGSRSCRTASPRLRRRSPAGLSCAREKDRRHSSAATVGSDSVTARRACCPVRSSRLRRMANGSPGCSFVPASRRRLR